MNKLALVPIAIIAGALCCMGFGAETPANPPRQVISLDGDWLFQRDGTKTDDWKTVNVPSSFDRHEGIEFHGVGWYRKVIPAFPLPAGKRVLLHFQAAATEAEVWWNGRWVGTHLGGWTPFRFDITEEVRKAAAGRPHELRVRLDEKVGHNTQGFLPIIAPHFGGLWQDVQLLVVPETYCDDLNLLAVGNLKTCEIQLDIPLCGKPPAAEEPVLLRCRLRGQRDWFTPPSRTTFTKDRLRVSAKLTSPRPWSPDEPNLYEVELTVGGKSGDRVCTRVGFRTIEACGPELRLNGRPLQVRGVLNWGYSPPLAAPNPGEAVWRREIEMAQRRGFNAMKFCLWVPPKRYLELADELGMLV
jgi:beta-galactosidase/beta-glucuronidase